VVGRQCSHNGYSVTIRLNRKSCGVVLAVRGENSMHGMVCWSGITRRVASNGAAAKPGSGGRPAAAAGAVEPQRGCHARQV